MEKKLNELKLRNQVLKFAVIRKGFIEITEEMEKDPIKHDLLRQLHAINQDKYVLQYVIT